MDKIQLFSFLDGGVQEGSKCCDHSLSRTFVSSKQSLKALDCRFFDSAWTFSDARCLKEAELASRVPAGWVLRQMLSCIEICSCKLRVSYRIQRLPTCVMCLQSQSQAYTSRLPGLGMQEGKAESCMCGLPGCQLHCLPEVSHRLTDTLPVRKTHSTPEFKVLCLDD